jgi:hypothetical protein
VDKKEVLKMDAGREMDLLVAQHVMGKELHEFFNLHNKEIPEYSLNSYLAEKIAEKIREKYPILVYGGALWECQVYLSSGQVVSSGPAEHFPLAVCKAALLTVIKEENQEKKKELGLNQKSKFFHHIGLNIEEKGRKDIRLLVSSLAIMGLIFLALWNVLLLKEIKTSKTEGGDLKKHIEKMEILERGNSNFIKDVLRQKAIALCFLDLVGQHDGKYTHKQKQDCIQLIVVTDEKYGHKGLDAPLILAWIEKESSGNPEAISYAGAKGLTQLMDFRADKILTAMGYAGYTEELVFDPVINLEGGICHLCGLLKYWSQNGIKSQSLVLFYALHSYKWGSGNTEELFNSDRKAERPAVEYTNWILNRREFWAEKLKYWTDNAQRSENERESNRSLSFFIGED